VKKSKVFLKINLAFFTFIKELILSISVEEFPLVYNVQDAEYFIVKFHKICNFRLTFLSPPCGIIKTVKKNNLTP